MLGFIVSSSSTSFSRLAPRVLDDLLDAVPRLDVAVKHTPDEIDAVLTHGKGDSQIAVHDFVNAVEWVLLIDNGIQQDTESPDVLLFTAIGFSSQDFWRSVI